MSEDLSDMMSKISNMLKNDSDPNRSQSNIENEVKSNGSASDSNSSNFNIDPDTISKLVSALSSNSSLESSDTSSSSTPNIDINTILKMKNIMDKMNQNQNDPRANLLLSLKPYLKKSRKDKVEQYIKLFQMTNVMDFLKANDNGGDSKK